MKIRLFASAALAAAALVSASARAETADDVIARNIAARGGMEKIKAIQSVDMKIKANQQGLEFPGTLEWKRPDKLRLEMTIQGKTMVQAYDGKTAWAIMPFLGSPDPQAMPADEAKDMIEQADMDGPIVDYKAKGNTVELVGREDVEGSPADKLKVTWKNGDVTYVYVDVETGLAVKETTRRKQKGSEVEIDSYMSNFKPVEGVLIPFAIENKVQGKSMGQFTIEEAKANVPIEDAAFAMPAPAAKPAPAADKEKK
jgi:outer membrane lipoprotein-sorting protein